MTPFFDTICAHIHIAVDYIHSLLSQKNELKSRVRDLQANLGEPTEDDSVSSFFH
jgi:hypothetical protein